MPHRQHINHNAAVSEPRARRSTAQAEWIAGTLVQLDAETGRFTLRVAEARRPGFRAEQELEVLVGDARLKVADGDGDGRPGVRDLFPGDQLHVVLAPGEPLTAARITQQSGGGEPGGLRRVWGET